MKTNTIRTFVCGLGIQDESKSSQDTASEKASTLSDEITSSVRFAKKVTIENSWTNKKCNVSFSFNFLFFLKINKIQKIYFFFRNQVIYFPRTMRK